MGGPSLVFPGADQYLAAAAQRARVPYTLGLVGGMTVERAAEIAPDVLWFQLYRCWRNEHAIGFDLVKRAEAAGVQRARAHRRRAGAHHALARGGGRHHLAVPARSAHAGRHRDLARLPHVAVDERPAALRQPQALYGQNAADVNEVAAFVRREMGGAFTWDEVARYRERWKRPLVVKGIMHPADAEKCVALGVDGIVVSNHGGRQVEGLPAPIDVLPAIAAAVGKRATVMMDSGVRSGLDVARAVALGADLAFAGKAFLWGLGALGARGARSRHRSHDRRDEGRLRPDRRAQSAGRALGGDPPSRRVRFRAQFDVAAAPLHAAAAATRAVQL